VRLCLTPRPQASAVLGHDQVEVLDPAMPAWHQHKPDPAITVLGDERVLEVLSRDQVGCSLRRKGEAISLPRYSDVAWLVSWKSKNLLALRWDGGPRLVGGEVEVARPDLVTEARPDGVEGVEGEADAPGVAGVSCRNDGLGRRVAAPRRDVRRPDCRALAERRPLEECGHAPLGRDFMCVQARVAEPGREVAIDRC
jgi:hypothetical protein